MEFEKYQHIERFGTIEVQGINDGMCYVFPKIDGTNASVWIEEYNDIRYIGAGSRKRELTKESDNAGFYEWVTRQGNIKEFLKQYPHLRLFGEWLVPHTLKTYREDAWRKLYVFDVHDGEKYLSYDEYSTLLEDFKIEYIPPIVKIKNPTLERLTKYLDDNTFLIDDGNGVGEGIVIKNYEYRNKFGRQTWAKIVRNEFKEKHTKTMGVREVKEKKITEESIVSEYVTIALIEKEFAKISNEMDGWSSRYIPRLLNTVYYCLITEDAWNFVKKYKNPTIDFKTLQHYTTAKIKEIKPELF